MKNYKNILNFSQRRLTMKTLLLFLLFSAAITAQAQIPKLDLGGLNKRIIVPTDRNFEPQKFTPVSGASRLAYEVWITTDGVMHCRTSLPLKFASFRFTAPIKYLTNANDGEPSVGDGAVYLPKLNKPEGSDAYLFDLTKTNYKEKHAITLFITSTSGSKAEITLTNKKVPAKIEK